MIIVTASDEQWSELTGTRTSVNWHRVENAAAFIDFTDATAFMSLNEIPANIHSLSKPVIVHSVIDTLAELKVPANVYRINGWPTFLKRTSWEIAGAVNDGVETVFKLLNINAGFVKDEPGFVAARIIAMIINEAYIALEEGISSKEEIDTAMKLGTNYPLGPFEWASRIGKHNILALLQKLHETDNRYKPSGLLINESAENQ